MSNSNGLHHQQDGSDEDDEAFDSAAHDAYYRPIYPSADADGEDDSDDKASASSDEASGGSRPSDQIRPNGFFYHHAEDGVAALDLDAGVAGPNVIAVEEEDEEEVERAREREASILRAFREDASRRSAPLTPENAARVVEAMRGVDFRGAPPDWADRVPEDQWVNRLRSLRDEPGTRG